MTIKIHREELGGKPHGPRRVGATLASFVHAQVSPSLRTESQVVKIDDSLRVGVAPERFILPPVRTLGEAPKENKEAL
ncbi:hypothetical protein [Streptomyces kebangsaanensis]|uniref:hypothetical protein n=1 Tax=Streptomyces kebangsaanensis TaxID=864058 RepID=UPI001160F8A1|nr:hypothetical protein [Streptomyces kebangsaanensis]